MAAVGADEPVGVRPAVEYTVSTAEVASARDSSEDVPSVNRSVDGSNRARFGNAVRSK